MLKTIVLALGFAVLPLASCAWAQTELESEPAPAWLTKDLADFTATFEGRWDNDRHVFFAEDAGLNPLTLAPRQHIVIEPILPPGGEPEEVGRAVFSAVRTVEGEAAQTLIHAFEADPIALSIRHTIAAAAGMLPPKMFDCHVNWRREGGQFRGIARGQECETLFPRPLEGGDLAVTMTLSDTEFWVASQRGPNVVEARLRRARPFECWTAILRGASHGDDGADMNDWFFQRGVKLHDQGGVAVLTTDEDPQRDIRLKLRDVDWPYGTNRPSLTMYVYEGESDRATSYAWGEAGAERIGINLRWMQASCTHAPDADD